MITDFNPYTDPPSAPPSLTPAIFCCFCYFLVCLLFGFLSGFDSFLGAHKYDVGAQLYYFIKCFPLLSNIPINPLEEEEEDATNPTTEIIFVPVGSPISATLLSLLT